MSSTMEVTARRLDTVEVAKEIRKVLKAEFPGQKFSVRSSRYSGGSSIDVNWTDGPTTKQVDAVVKRFQGADFNGMIDLKEYRDPVLLANADGSYEEVRYGVDYVMTQRRYSDTVEDATKAEIARLAGVETFEYNGRYDVAADRETGELFACTGQVAPEYYGSEILHRSLYVRDLR